jgi:hypothetical protein
MARETFADESHFDLILMEVRHRKERRRRIGAGHESDTLPTWAAI